MIKVDEQEVMRREFYLEGKSIRQIAREHRHSRETVKQALVDPSVRKYQLKQERKRPVMGSHEAVVEAWLREDQRRPVKQRHTAHRIFERLRDEHGYGGAESTVRQWVRVRKLGLGMERAESYVPLVYAAGQDAQVDFGEAEVVLNSVVWKVQYLVMVLCYSTLPFVMAFPHQRQEAFFEGHAAAFAWFGGVPRRIWYDNLKPAVQRILEGHKRQEQEAFVSLRSYYLFESRFCTPGEGHEKGLVEAMVGQVRRNFMTPRPEATDWGSLNVQLLARCEAEKIRCRYGETQTIGDRWAEERTSLLPLPATPFAACVQTLAQVNKLRLVAFDGNTYSVPLPAGVPQQRVLVQGYVHRVVLSWQGAVLAEHPRCYGKGQEIINPLHYLDLLEQRPRAFDHAKPIQEWRGRWPSVYEDYLAALRLRLAENEAVRRFVQVLRLHETHPAPAVAEAVRQALTLDCFHPDSVRHLLLVGQDASPAAVRLDLAEHPHLLQAPVVAPELSRYNQLFVAEVCDGN